MKQIGLIALVGLSGVAHAGYVLTGFQANQWGASDATLGVAGYTIEDFEDVNLVSGLQVSVSSANGGYGPTSTLPNTFNPFTDNTQGVAFQVGGGGVWDGTRGLLNTRTNREVPYTEAGSWGTTTFTFLGGASSVGFSVQQMNLNTALFINGTQVSILNTELNWPLDGSRQGYVRIDATGGDVINNVLIANGTGDGLMFDHLAFNPVPEPATMGLLTLVGLTLLRKRRS
jgi:hypothetical protein